MPARPGRVWLRITGYGTDAGSAERVAFGDDAAVAGGLVGYDGAGPVFVGDAIADPLTGLEAAAAVVRVGGPRRRRADRVSHGRGGGDLRRAARRTGRHRTWHRPVLPACVHGAPHWAPTTRQSNGSSLTDWSPKSLSATC